MDVIEQLKQDVRDGRIGPERLFDVIATLQRQLEAALRRIEELEKNAANPMPPAAGSAAKVQQPFSMRAEEKRQRQRGKGDKHKLSRNSRRGRLSTADKVKRAERTESCFPEGVPHEQCSLSHTRPVWRLEKGRAILVAYEIYRGPKNQYGQIPGVLDRGEFGLEVVVQIAYLVHFVGLSFDKVCVVLQFLQNLHLKKSQVDALLTRLARQWQGEFDVLCTLLANSMVVHADETSWSINSVWAFLSEKARVLLFGVHKDGETLTQILDPEKFAGLVISDDAAVYGKFNQAQKCWAHLLRKAIKLTLQEPNEQEYRQFTDRLLAIYRRACRVQRDGRLGDAGRSAKVAALEDEVLELCAPLWALDLPPLEEGSENDYRLLVNEVMRLMLDRQLLTFVTAPAAAQPNGTSQAVAGTNNEAERTLRNAAQARVTGRTNKTVFGARRQTILVSVLESLRVYLKTFTVSSIVAEIERWRQAGQSCFRKLLHKMKLQVPAKSVLDTLMPIPSG
jgi:hypothetical protein